MNLKAPCQHGRYDAHRQYDGSFHPEGDCPGGSLLPPDSLVIVKEDGEWPDWALTALGQPVPARGKGLRASVLDALAAAQPGPEPELDRNQLGMW